MLITVATEPEVISNSGNSPQGVHEFGWEKN